MLLVVIAGTGIALVAHLLTIKQSESVTPSLAPGFEVLGRYPAKYPV